MISKKITLKILFLSAVLIASPVLYAQEEVEELSFPVTQVSAFKHYTAHMFTDTVGWLAALTALGATLELGGALLENSEAPGLAGTLLALYIRYKIPQWTDDYILKLGRKRSTGENMFSFFARFAPFGLFISERWLRDSDWEYAQKEFAKKQEAAAG